MLKLSLRRRRICSSGSPKGLRASSGSIRDSEGEKIVFAVPSTLSGIKTLKDVFRYLSPVVHLGNAVLIPAAIAPIREIHISDLKYDVR